MSSQHYLRGGPTGDVARMWAAAMLIVSIGLAAAVRSLPLSAIFAIIGFVSLYRIFKPPQPGSFVDLGPDHLVLNSLLRIEIRYRDIESADFRRFSLCGPLRAIVNVFIALGRTAGGNTPWEGRAGEIDSTAVIIRFRKTLWLPLPLPPFILPRKSFGFYFQDPPAFLSDISERLSAEGVESNP